MNKAKEIIAKHKGVSTEAKNEFSKWVRNNKDLKSGEKSYQFLNEDGRVYQSVGMSWPNPNPAPEQFFKPLIHPKTKKPCPVPPRGWSRSPKKMKELLDKDEIIFGDDEAIQPRRKLFLETDTKKALSSIISNGSRGKVDIDKLGLNFDYCHPVSLYKELNKALEFNERTIFLDYFAGTGTTFHATQLLNKDDNGKRKCILLEQGNYVYTVILPRIKKIAYTFDWKEGKPKNGSMNGLGVFLKYQKLEQYEESLENISFNLSEDAQQKALEFEEYIPKYFLEFETKNSSTLVNTEAMENPWDYKLKVWDGYTYDTQKAVDLVDTFNYLIGLHVQKYITKEINGKRYQFVHGNNNSNKKILVVWRSIKEWKKEDYEKDRETLKVELKNYEYDLLYINGQAHWENYQPVEQVFKSKMVS